MTGMRSRLDGKVAVVTGAGSGFGEAIAVRFAQEGAKVMLGDIDVTKVQTVAARIERDGGCAQACKVDVTDGASMGNFVTVTQTTFGKLDVFVNNAGASQRYAPAHTTSELEYDHLFDVNMKSIYWSVVKAVPLLRQVDGGVMLSITSIGAIRPRVDTSWYCAAKGAAVTATKALALELARDKIRVCALAPVAADTPLLAAALSAYASVEGQAHIREQFIAGVPLGRLCTPEDVANAALFLVSDEAAFLTGVCLEVDGGRSL